MLSSLQPDIAWEHFSQPAVEPKSCAKVLTFNVIEKFYAVFYSFLTLYLILTDIYALNIQVCPKPLSYFWRVSVILPT